MGEHLAKEVILSDALQKLHTTMLDTREGYVAAKRDAESEPLKSLFQSMIDLRDRDHAEIHASLVARGEEPDEGTSLMATVHKAAVGVRSAVTGIDRSALEPFISGEEAVLEEYDAAIAEGDGSTSEMLKRQKASVITLVDAMRAFKA